MRSKTYTLVLLFYFLALRPILGQLPTSNCYLFDFEITAEGMQFKNGKYLTSFNPNGYNNQISFLSKKKFLLSSNFYDSEQTDIIQLDLENKTMRRITKTMEDEYSPYINRALGKISTVRVESNKDQLLQLYDRTQDGYASCSPLLKEQTKIGYYLWGKKQNLFLYLTTEDEGGKLAIANPSTERVIPIIDNIGRCLKLGEDGNLYFVHKVTETAWYIKSYNPVTRELTQHIRALRGKEDFEMIGQTIISGSGSLLYKYDMGVDTEWTKYADLSPIGIKNITRLKLRDNKMLLVDKSAK